MSKLMGRNEYARHRGCSPAAVTKAAESGRIGQAVVRNQSGEIEAIDWRLADVLWAANTDPVQASRSETERGTFARQTATEQEIELPALLRALALARVDCLEDAERIGYRGAVLDAQDLAELVDLYLELLAHRLEAAISLSYGAAVRALLVSAWGDGDRRVASIEGAIAAAKAAVPGAKPMVLA